MDDNTRRDDLITFLNVSSPNITAVGLIHDCEPQQGNTWEHFKLRPETSDNQYIKLLAAKDLQDANRNQRIQIRASKSIVSNMVYVN